jgi:hypothetical protein
MIGSPPLFSILQHTPFARIMTLSFFQKCFGEHIGRDLNHNLSFLWSINHFFVDIDMCLGLLSCWKIHLQPSFSLLAEATRFLAEMSWYLVKVHDTFDLTRAPGPLEEKLPHYMKDPTSYFTVEMR